MLSVPNCQPYPWKCTQRLLCLLAVNLFIWIRPDYRADSQELSFAVGGPVETAGITLRLFCIQFKTSLCKFDPPQSWRWKEVCDRITALPLYLSQVSAPPREHRLDQYQLEHAKARHRPLLFKGSITQFFIQ